MTKNDNILDNFINSAISEAYKKEQNEVNKANQITIKSIKKILGRKYSKISMIKEDGVYIGDYKFIGRHLGSLFNGNLEYKLYYIDSDLDSPGRVLIKSLAEFGEYIKDKNQLVEI